MKTSQRPDTPVRRPTKAELEQPIQIDATPEELAKAFLSGAAAGAGRRGSEAARFALNPVSGAANLDLTPPARP